MPVGVLLLGIEGCSCECPEQSRNPPLHTGKLVPVRCCALTPLAATACCYWLARVRLSIDCHGSRRLALAGGGGQLIAATWSRLRRAVWGSIRWLMLAANGLLWQDDGDVFAACCLNPAAVCCRLRVGGCEEARCSVRRATRMP